MEVAPSGLYGDDNSCSRMWNFFTHVEVPLGLFGEG
jgi:hypothetical protein